MAQHPPGPERGDGPGLLDGLDTLIARWRAQGADRAEPVRFQLIDSLARRAQAPSGALRAVLERRLVALLAAHGEQLDRACAKSAAAVPPVTPGPLAELLRALGRPAAAQGELKALSQHRGTWARLSIDRQLSRSQQQAPDNPGPLNSQRLVLRALQQMQALSPAYLGRFVSQIEALMWLEQAGQAPAASPGRPARRESKARAGRGKAG